MNRRSFLKAIFFISSIFTFRVSASKKNNISFDYGVASGDPTNSNVILWTRVTSSLNKDKAVVCFVYVNTVKSNIYKLIDSNKFEIKLNTPII